MKGPAILVDLETDQRLEVLPDYVKNQYRAKMDNHMEEMRNKTRSAGMGYHLLTTDKPLDLALTEYLSLRQSQVGA
jgi:UDP-N-acetylglucosamine transferase subunit ALG13